MAGVSISTVSRVINGTAPVAAATVSAVRRAIDHLNYKPSAAARALAGLHSNTIGLLMPAITGAFFTPLVRGIEEGARRADFDLLIHLSGYDNDHDANPISALDAHNTDGLIVFLDRLDDERIRQSWQSGVPLLLLFRSPPQDTDVPYIKFENTRAAEEIVEHLIVVHGRRRIAFLSGPPTNEDSAQREEGYHRALAGNDIPFDPSLVRQADFSTQKAHEVVAEWLTEDPDFDAIFAGDDGAAAGAMLALREAGIRMPDEVAVVGFDDLEFADLLTPSLTTVRAPVEFSGLLASEYLLAMIRGEKVRQETLLPTELVIRRSCGCP